MWHQRISEICAIAGPQRGGAQKGDVENRCAIMDSDSLRAYWCGVKETCTSSCFPTVLSLFTPNQQRSPEDHVRIPKLQTKSGSSSAVKHP